MNRHKSNIINKTVDKIEADIQLYHQEEQLHRSQLADRLENLEAIRLHQSPSHTEADRAKIKFDPEYSLRHHLDSAAASIMSAPSSPSFVVSSLGEDKDSMVTSDHASFWTSLSRLSCDISQEEGFLNEFDRDQVDESQTIASTHDKTWSTSQFTKTCMNEIYIQIHTGARLKVMVAADDTPRTVLSRIKDLDGFWSYWSEKGFFTYACKPVDPEERLEQFLGSTTPTFWFRTGHPMFSSLQENQAPRAEPAIPEVPKIVQHQRRNKPIIRSKQSLIRQIYRQSTLGVR